MKNKCEMCEKHKESVEFVADVEMNICDECLHDNYFYCDECNKWKEQEDAVYISDKGEYVCLDCAEAYYYQCSDCGNWHEHLHGINNGAFHVCENCLENYYYCDECLNYFTEDSMHFTEDYSYCDECYHQIGGGILEYHEFNDWDFYKTETEEIPDYYIGAEIETEPLNYDNYTREILESIDRNIPAVAMSDSSLNSGGFEIVTHPQSWSYFEKKKENYKNVFRTLQDCNYGNNGGAGLHFHITRPSKEIISRIIIILESFKREVKILSRRPEHSLEQWARFVSDADCFETQEEKLKYRSKKYLEDNYISNGGAGRYMALNLCNSNTIEFRFFNGANNFDEFWSSLQFIKNLFEIANDTSRELNTITWDDLVVGDELEKEAEKLYLKNINTKVIDTTEILEKINQAREEIIKNTKRILGNLMKTINNNIAKLAEDNKKMTKKDLINMKFSSNELILELRFLEYINHIYNSAGYNQFVNLEQEIKSGWSVRSKKYERYLKQIDKVIKSNRIEVSALCV